MKISLVLVVVFFLNKINIFLSHLFCEDFLFLLIKVKEILFHKIIIIKKTKKRIRFFLNLLS